MTSLAAIRLPLYAADLWFPNLYASNISLSQPFSRGVELPEVHGPHGLRGPPLRRCAVRFVNHLKTKILGFPRYKVELLAVSKMFYRAFCGSIPRVGLSKYRDRRQHEYFLRLSDGENCIWEEFAPLVPMDYRCHPYSLDLGTIWEDKGFDWYQEVRKY